MLTFAPKIYIKKERLLIMNRFIVLLGMLGTMSPMFAQNKISGKVVDDKGEALAFANVVLLNRQDSAFVTGTVSGEDGKFIIDTPLKNGIIKITSVGYKTICKDYTSENLGIIAMSDDSKMLGEVVVKSTLPKTIMRNGGMTTTVVGSVLEKAGTMENLLDRIPNVTAQNGKIKVFGRGDAVIYINGRQIRDNNELERLHSDNIKSVEVITNPGARYAANTKAVIRIVTKKRQGDGFGIEATTEGEYDEFKHLGGYSRVNMNYRVGGLDLGAYAFGAYRYEPGEKNIEQVTYLDQRWNESMHISQYDKLQSFSTKLSASYQFDTDNSAGASVWFHRNPSIVGIGEASSSLLRDESLQETSSITYRMPRRQNDITGNVYYVGKIGKLDIDFNTDWYWEKENRNYDNKEEITETGKEQQTQNVNSKTVTYNRLLASKLLLSYPLLGGNLSFGGEYSSTHRNTTYRTLPVGLVDDDDSKVKENMSSAFLSYACLIGKFSLEAGLRYEYIDFDYYEEGKYVPTQSKTYGNIFPSLTLATALGEVQMQLGYASDIKRPSYWELRSGVTFDNRYTYEAGNPFMLPEISRNLSYGLAYKWMALEMVYSHISDPILPMMEVYKDNPAIGVLREVNGDSFDTFNASVSLQPTFGIWHPAFTAGMSKQWLKMDTHEGKMKKSPLGSFRFDNTFDTKWASLSLLMSYTTKGYDRNSWLRKSSFNTNLSIFKSCMKNCLTFQLYVYDLFNTNVSRSVNYYGPMKEMLADIYSTSKVSLTVRYKFNASRSKYKGTGAGESQKSRM